MVDSLWFMEDSGEIIGNAITKQITTLLLNYSTTQLFNYFTEKLITDY